MGSGFVITKVEIKNYSNKTILEYQLTYQTANSNNSFFIVITYNYKTKEVLAIQLKSSCNNLDNTSFTYL